MMEDNMAVAVWRLTLVDASGDVAGRCAQTHVQDECGGHERAAVGGRQEPQAGKHWNHTAHT